MKINVIIPSFYPAVIYGGPVFTSLHTAEQLSDLGLEIRVSTTNANMNKRLVIKTNIWLQKKENLFVKYYNETIINYLSLTQIFLVWKDILLADIIHLQVLFRDLVPFVLLYAKIFKKPLLLTPHGVLGIWCLSSGSRFKTLWLKYLIKPFNSTIIWHATAEMEKQEILSVFPDASVQVIPNGIRLQEFQHFNLLDHSQFIKKFTNKSLEAEKVIVSMGRLQKKKGFNILIDAFTKILLHYPHGKLLIAGQDEGEKQNLRSQIEHLGLKEKVFLIGPISGQDKVDFLANADLFVLPSHNENFGVVYAESLASGTPIVASRNTPWAEVENANCGKWVHNSIEDTAQAMLEMLEKNRKQMRKNAKELARKYDWRNIAIQFRNLFEQMVRK